MLFIIDQSQPSLFPQQRQGLVQLHQLLVLQVLEVLEDELAAQLLQLLSVVGLCHLGNFQDVVFVCLLASNDGPNSIFEILHQVEIRHCQKTLAILDVDVLWNSNSVDEVHNCCKDRGEHSSTFRILLLLFPTDVVRAVLKYSDLKSKSL